MTKDFDSKADKPSWPLSSYGPAKNEKNLLPSLDESPEELRFKAVTAMQNGSINEYVRTLIVFYQTILDHIGESFNTSKISLQMLSRSL
jgi:nucleoporin NUP42